MMKKIYTLLLSACALAVFSTGQADPWEGFYVEGFGGANFIQTSKHDDVKLNFRTGYVVGGAIGYRMCEGLRIEGEISYRYNQLKSFVVKNEEFDDVKFCTHGHLREVAYMANLIYDIDTCCWDPCWTACGQIFPYIGGGIGYGQQKLSGREEDEDEFLIFDAGNRKNGFAWQIIAGIGYDFSPCADISIEYRFHKGALNHVYNHMVGIAAKYHF